MSEDSNEWENWHFLIIFKKWIIHVFPNKPATDDEGVKEEEEERRSLKEETEETGDALPRVPPASSVSKPGRKEMETREREESEGID